ncbi:hypothetical protein ANTRET_LOCUS9702 [Anthophora retusa]
MNLYRPVLRWGKGVRDNFIQNFGRLKFKYWGSMEQKIKDTSDFSRRSKQKEAVFNKELEYWMTRLPEPLKNIPIIHLAIPATASIVPIIFKRI